MLDFGDTEDVNELMPINSHISTSCKVLYKNMTKTNKKISQYSLWW